MQIQLIKSLFVNLRRSNSFSSPKRNIPFAISLFPIVLSSLFLSFLIVSKNETLPKEEEEEEGCEFSNSFLFKASHWRAWKRKRVRLRLTSICSSIITDSKEAFVGTRHVAPCTTSMRITLENKEASSSLNGYLRKNLPLRVLRHDPVRNN